MNQTNIKLCALVLAILMVLSFVPVLTTAALPSSYSQSSNSGTRGEVCTSLAGTSVSSYYTGSYAFESLTGQSGSSLKSSLHDLMTNTHKTVTSYADCRDYVFQVDCEKNDTSHATTLYTNYHMTSSDWSPSWACNREHVWPQSLGGGTTSGGGADLHHIRPAEAGVNSTRGNKPYGESSSKYYEPADHVKGAVARIVLYVYVRWGTAWGADSLTEVFESEEILLAWCELDPVDTWEMGRNEVVQRIQGNRNVFIDYPELAWLMLGEEVPSGMITPSLSVYEGELPTPPATEEQPDTPTDPDVDVPTPPSGSEETLAVFDFGANGGAAHNDGTEITAAKSYTDGEYTLTLTSPTKLYGNARDAKGNSCLKMGSSKATGSFTFTVDEDVDKVVLHIAKYKANGTAVIINGTRHSVSTASDDGAYTPITVDTSATKTVTVATVSGSSRCMINTIEFLGKVSTPDTEPPVSEPVTEPVTDIPTQPDVEPDTEATTGPEADPETQPDTEEPSDTQDDTDATTDSSGDNGDSGNNGNGDRSDGNGCRLILTSGVGIMAILCAGAVAILRKRDHD